MTRGSHIEEIHESGGLFRTFADSAPSMICLFGPDRRATFFNPAWLSFTGNSLAQELGDGWLRGVHPDDVDCCLAGYNSSFDALRTSCIEYRLRRAGGEYRLIACTISPWYKAGALEGYVASCTDVADVKPSQEEAFDRRELENLRALTGGVAHDFNNLMGSILAQAELLETELPQDLSHSQAIQRIKGLATQSAEIGRELMVYSGQQKAALEPLNISQIVEDMLELLKLTISKHASLKTDLARRLPSVLGRAAQVRQVVMNLVMNASEAIGEHEGIILVNTSQTSHFEEPAADWEPGPPEGDYVRLEVADTGSGIAEESRGQIFDRFFTTKPSGHGLGLAVVQRIVRAHGGAIRVSGAAGRGARFEVLLPCARRSAKT
jgi:two-component system cell cycle sensor histidine kinase/response regulator CckA